jgi:hypothetical protein
MGHLHMHLPNQPAMAMAAALVAAVLAAVVPMAVVVVT